MVSFVGTMQSSMNGHLFWRDFAIRFYLSIVPSPFEESKANHHETVPGNACRLAQPYKKRAINERRKKDRMRMRIVVGTTFLAEPFSHGFTILDRQDFHRKVTANKHRDGESIQIITAQLNNAGS